MPTTPFIGRRPLYIETYARAVSAAARYEDLLSTVREEQDRLSYLDSLITAERQTLAALSETFRARPVDLSQVQAVLREQYSIDDAARQRAAGARSARAAAVSLPARELAILNDVISTDSRADVAAIAIDLATGATPERADLILAQIAATGALSAPEVSQLRGRIDQRTAAYRGGTGGAVDTERQREVSAAMEVLLSSSPEAIRGGFAGREIADLRTLTATALRRRSAESEEEAVSEYLQDRAEALEDSAFATAEEAYQAALEIVRTTGDPSAIEDAFARDIYEEAREKQAYRNDQRADFEEEVLSSRKRLSDLDSRRASSPGAQYDDPAREVYRRELEARGFDFERNDGRYIQYQQSPYYDALIKADDLVSSVLETGNVLEAVDADQRLARDLLLALDRADKPYDIDTLRKQLGKTMKGEQLDDAVAFALAFKEQTSRNLDDPSQLERQRKIEGTQKTQREEAEKTAEARSVERRAEEARLVDAEARAKTAPPARSFEADFLSRRISGMSRDEAARAAREASGRNRRPVSPPVATPTTQRRLRTPTPAPTPTPTPAPTVAPTPAPTPERRADPSNPAFEYQPTAAGDYIVYRDGVRTGRAVKGSTAFRSIESVLSGGQPLARPPAPPPEEEAPPPGFGRSGFEIRGTPPAAASFGRRPGETDEQYERRLLGE